MQPVQIAPSHRLLAFWLVFWLLQGYLAVSQGGRVRLALLLAFPVLLLLSWRASTYVLSAEGVRWSGRWGLRGRLTPWSEVAAVRRSYRVVDGVEIELRSGRRLTLARVPPDLLPVLERQVAAASR